MVGQYCYVKSCYSRSHDQSNREWRSFFSRFRTAKKKDRLQAEGDAYVDQFYVGMHGSLS